MKVLGKIIPILVLSVFLGVSVYAKPLIEDEMIGNDLENDAAYEDSNELVKENKANKDALGEERNFFFLNEEDDKDIEESVAEDDDSEAENPENDSEDEEDEKVIDEESIEQSGDDGKNKDIDNEEDEEKDIDVVEDEVKNIDDEKDEEILDEKTDVIPKEPPIAWHEKVRRYFANWGK